MFNVFNVTNILGTSTVNYSGFANGLVRDSNDPSNPGYLRSSAFGMPVSTAGGEPPSRFKNWPRGCGSIHQPEDEIGRRRTATQRPQHLRALRSVAL